MTASFRSDSTDVDAVIQITANLVDHPTRATIFSQKEVPSDLRTLVENTLTEKVRKQKFERYNIPELNSIVDDMQKSIEVATIRWTDEGGAGVYFRNSNSYGYGFNFPYIYVCSFLWINGYARCYGREDKPYR